MKSGKIAMMICSKGAWGLLVLLELRCIFTTNSISLAGTLRQLKHYDSIDAGPHLMAKEFRYLRILIVKTAVYPYVEFLANFIKVNLSHIIRTPSKSQTLYNLL